MTAITAQFVGTYTQLFNKYRGVRSGYVHGILQINVANNGTALTTTEGSISQFAYRRI